jgi:glycosyltransferase involved in cell wall biosynthesis
MDRAPIRVALVCPDIAGRAPGGMASVSRSLAEALSNRAGFSVTTISNFDEGGLGARVRAGLRPIIRVVLSSRSFDLVHIQAATGRSIERELVLALASRAFGLPVVLHFHGAGQIEDFQNGSRLHKLCYRMLMRVTSMNLALGQRTCGWIEQTTGDHRSAKVVPNGVQVQSSVPSLKVAKATFVFVGRLGARKGTFDLLDAVRLLVAEGCDFNVMLAGDGDLEGVRRIVEKDPSLSNVITVLGWQTPEQVQQLIIDAWALVLPSYAEGLPMAALEAMSWGRAIIVSRVGDVEDLVVDGSSGLLVDSGDIEALASALRKVISNRSWAEDAGHLGFQLVSERFNEADVISSLCEVYMDVVSAKGSSA